MYICHIRNGNDKCTGIDTLGQLYNGAPAGWAWLPRELGEVGGASVNILSQAVHRVLVFDRALHTYECVGLFANHQWDKSVGQE